MQQKFVFRKGTIPMKRTLGFALLLSASLLSLFTPNLSAQAQHSTSNYDVQKDGPIPPELAHPGAIFIANGSSDIARFSYTFTGDSSRAYAEFYNALKASGAYRLVAQPDQADLVVEIKTSSRSIFGYNGGDNSMSQPCLRATVIDRRSDIPIWSMIQPIDFALFHKNRDKAFERAMQRIVAEFEAFSNVAPKTAPVPANS